MRYFFVFNLFLFLLSSCDSKQLEESEVASRSPEMVHLEADTTKIKYGKPFFNYDEIDYYHIDIHHPILEGELSFYDSMLDRAIFNNVISVNNSYTTIYNDDKIYEEENFKYYPELGFKKYKVKQEDFPKIDQVFCAKSGAGELSSAACVPVYRDHLVFKKRNRIIGHAFICLGCNMFSVNGKVDNRDGLGYEIDKIRLTRVFSKYDKNAAKHY
jgi:hypothetical protein